MLSLTRLPILAILPPPDPPEVGVEVFAPPRPPPIEVIESNTESPTAVPSWLSPLGPMTFVFSTNLSKASTDETEGFNFNLGTTF